MVWHLSISAIDKFERNYAAGCDEVIEEDIRVEVMVVAWSKVSVKGSQGRIPSTTLLRTVIVAHVCDRHFDADLPD